MKNDTSLESSYSLLFKSAKKIPNLQNYFVLQDPVVFAKNNFQSDKLYIVEKTVPFQICKKFSNIFSTLMCNKEKLKFSFDGLYANN